MSTSENKYGSNVYPGWIWILPNSVYDAPNVITVVRDGVTIGFSIREYFEQPEANVGLFSNRQIKPLVSGTHSIAMFDSDITDIQEFESMLTAQGMVNGNRDFTLNLPNVFYSMPIGKYVEFEVVSPLNQGVME